MKKILIALLCLFLAGCTKVEENKELPKEVLENYTFSSDESYQETDLSVISNQTNITESGSYVLSGEYDSDITIDADGDVVLYLNNANISGNLINKNSNLIISLVPGTKNTVSEIQSVSKTVFNGSGSLSTKGIQSTSDLVFMDGDYAISSADHGIQSDCLIAVKNGTFDITSTEGDGIHVSNEENEGYIYLENGSFTINNQRDGISCDGNLAIRNGNYQITTTELLEDESQKGIKATNTLEISNGQFDMNTIDDSFNTKGDFYIMNMTTTITTPEKGMHADGTLLFYHGEVNMESCDEGMEAKVLQIENGNIFVNALDDGFNADDKAVEVEGAQDGVDIIINGGSIIIQAQGDGIDSNNSIHMNGGKLFVYSNGSDNAALDYESEMVLTGGELIACGPMGMAATPSKTSTQPFITSMANGQGTLQLLSDENILLEWETPGNFMHVVLSHPSLVENETYTIQIGEMAQEVTATFEGQNGMFGGGMFNPGNENFDPNQRPENGQMPGDFDPSQIPGNGQMPGDFDPSQIPENGQMPEGFDPSQIPENGEFDPNQRPGGGRFPQNGGQTPEDGFANIQTN